MCSIPTFLLLAVGVPWVTPQTILQRPESVVQGARSTASLNCSVEGSSNPSLYWYRQTPGGWLEQLSYSIVTGSTNDAWPDHLKGTRPDDKNFNLEITNLRSNDTAVYYCAWSLTLGQVNASL
ncbi:hypothetical protein JRQ81_013339 [Phrynocephalus forsythii]|uniref:Ig-like domain-containing protein n=1 Tax=Phrynocephalus forsythii TaxID=171643 RepID=A0A9Q0Y273_9SAUR|nr:hypothetical protein JRQ81_013339 [Phrynocephalus forsythii]